jgi:hypothetical protein
VAARIEAELREMRYEAELRNEITGFTVKTAQRAR